MEKAILKKSSGLLCQGNEVKYSFIAQHEKTWPIDPMCRVLGVKRNGYYRYRNYNQMNKNDGIHQQLLQTVQDIAAANDHNYGSRRLQKELNGKGYPVGRYKTRKLMKEARVSVRYRKPYKVTTNSDHALPVFDNLLNRQFDVLQTNQVYVADITYIWTQEGWLYLAVVLDLFSRKVVGWSMSARMRAALVCDALTMAIWQRRPAPGLIHHSDRGVQYASRDFRQLLTAQGILGSMSRKGNC
jgi:putative transposase